MRSTIPVVVCLSALLACSPAGEPPVDPYYESCKLYLESVLKAPATLQVQLWEHEITSDDSHLVSITYDAANSFGTPLRGEFECRYEPWPEESEQPTPSFLVAEQITSDGEAFSEVEMINLNLEFLVNAGKRRRGQQPEP